MKARETARKGGDLRCGGWCPGCSCITREMEKENKQRRKKKKKRKKKGKRKKGKKWRKISKKSQKILGIYFELDDKSR